MIQSTDEIPINFGIYAKANSLVSKTAEVTDFPKELEDQLIAGAIGFVLSSYLLLIFSEVFLVDLINKKIEFLRFC